MSLPVSDNFAGTNLDPLNGAKWGTALVGDYQITANQAQGTNGAGFNMKPSIETFAADQEAQCLVNYGAGSAAGPGVRYQTGAASGYVVSCYDTGTNTAAIVRMDAGANTAISGSVTCANGDTWKIRAVGTTISAYRNGSGTPDLTATDATYATGKGGIFSYLAAAVDDFLANNVGAGVNTGANLLLLGVG